MTDGPNLGAAPATPDRQPAPWWVPDTKAVIALAIIALFAWAYVSHPTDIMGGALIAAFAGAWGYYLGSSKSAGDIRAQVGQALAKLPDGGAGQ